MKRSISQCVVEKSSIRFRSKITIVPDLINLTIVPLEFLDSDNTTWNALLTNHSTFTCPQPIASDASNRFMLTLDSGEKVLR